MLSNKHCVQTTCEHENVDVGWERRPGDGGQGGSQNIPGRHHLSFIR